MKSKNVTLFSRDTEKKEKISRSSLSKIREKGEKYDENLKKKADKDMKDRIAECKTKEQVKKALNSGKAARVNFCSVNSSGEKCAEYIEKELGAEVRGTFADKNEKPGKNEKCIICNAPADEVVYIGRSY